MPLGQPVSFEAQPPALASVGIAEAENELRALVRAGYRVIVCFPHPGEAERTRLALRRVEAEPPGEGARSPSPACDSRSRASVTALSRLRCSSRCFPRCSCSAVAARAARSDRTDAGDRLRSARGRLRRSRGSWRGPFRPVRHQRGRRSRARLPVSRVQGRGSALRPPRSAGQGQSLRGLRRPGPGTQRSSAARPGRRSRPAPASRCASWPASCLRCTPAVST